VDDAGAPVSGTTADVVEPGASMELPTLAPPQTESSTAQSPEMPAAEQPSIESGRMDLPLPESRPATSNEPAPPAMEPESALPGDTDSGTGAIAVTAPNALAPVSIAEDSTEAETETAAAQTTPPAAGEVRIELRINDDSWVEVQTADGSKLVIDLMHKGETRSITGKAPLSVLLGNAAGVEVSVDGKPFDHRRYDRDNIARFEIGRKP
jgi:cytoskeleton protein RodZ